MTWRKWLRLRCRNVQRGHEGRFNRQGMVRWIETNCRETWAPGVDGMFMSFGEVERDAMQRNVDVAQQRRVQECHNCIYPAVYANCLRSHSSSRTPSNTSGFYCLILIMFCRLAAITRLLCTKLKHRVIIVSAHSFISFLSPPRLVLEERSCLEQDEVLFYEPNPWGA